jgi:hypothetical protein
MFPGVRVMAMSREGLEIDRAGVAAIPIDLVDLKLVSLGEEPCTVGAAPALVLAQGGPSRPARRVWPASLPPIHPIPSVRTPMAGACRVAQTGGVTLGGEGRVPRTGGWRGTHLAGCLAVPGPVRHPPCRWVGVSPARPGTQLHPGETSQATHGRLPDPSAIVVGPTAYVGVELVAQGRLGPVLTGPHDATQRREGLLDGGLGRCDQGVVPETWTASGASPGLVLTSPLRPERPPPQVQARLIAFPGVGEPSGVHVACSSDPRPPCRQPLRTGGANGAIRVEHQAVIGVSHDTGLRRDVGEGLLPPMPSDPRSERCTTPAVRCACSGGGARVRCEES